MTSFSSSFPPHPLLRFLFFFLLLFLLIFLLLLLPLLLLLIFLLILSTPTPPLHSYFFLLLSLLFPSSPSPSPPLPLPPLLSTLIPPPLPLPCLPERSNVVKNLSLSLPGQCTSVVTNNLFVCFTSSYLLPRNVFIFLFLAYLCMSASYYFSV